MTNTIIAPAAAGITTMFFEQKLGGNKLVRYDFSALVNGILGGLVSVTAGCNVFEPWAAFLVGCIGSFVYIGSERLTAKLKIDDPI